MPTTTPNRRFRLPGSPAAAGLIALGIVAALSTARAAPVSFKRDVAPILSENCLACHGPKKAEGGYRVDSFERAAGEGASGIDGFVAGELEESEAFRRIASDDETERMPLGGEPLPAEKVAILRRWIKQGARYDAEDPAAPLVSIIPPPIHPAAPEVYPATLPITALAFSPNGQELLAAGYHEITAWNPQDGSLLRRIGNIGERTYSLEFSPDGKLLAAACGAPGRHGEVRLLDADSGEVRRVMGATGDVVLDAAFSPDGKRLASAAADNLIRIFDVETGAELLTIGSHADWVSAVAFSPDGRRIASASRDKSSKIFDAESGELLVTFTEHEEPVTGVVFHPDGQKTITGGKDGKVRVWKLDDGKIVADSASAGGQVLALARGGEFLFVGGADKTLRTLEPQSKQELRRDSSFEEAVLSIAYDPGTRRLAGGAFNGEIRVTNSETGKPLAAWTAAPGFSR